MNTAFIVALFSFVTGTLGTPIEDSYERHKFDEVLNMYEILEAHESANELKELLNNGYLLEELMKAVEDMIDEAERVKHGSVYVKCFGTALKTSLKCAGLNVQLYDIYACADITWSNFKECFLQPTTTTQEWSEEISTTPYYTESQEE